MGFIRFPASTDGAIPQRSQAGVGFAANVLPANFNAETDETLFIAQVSGGLIVQGSTLTSDVVYTLPTATIITAEWSQMNIGDAYTFYVGNNQAASFDVVIAVGAGITAVGTNNSLSVPPQASRMFTLVKTATTTYDLY